ncbi:MAG: YitT family protein, partial [Acetatifactor sp.]|nr:YitT family protein [Acetatifactor sp.]
MHNELEKQKRLRFRQLEQWKRVVLEYVIITVATLLMVVGVHFFKFPNHFSFGGVTGVAVVLGAVLNHSAATYTFIINMVLLVFGFLFLGKEFGLKTLYFSVLTSVRLDDLETS